MFMLPDCSEEESRYKESESWKSTFKEMFDTNQFCDKMYAGIASGPNADQLKQMSRA